MGGKGKVYSNCQGYLSRVKKVGKALPVIKRGASQNSMEVQSGRGALICVTVYVNRELVATFTPFGRERLGKWLLENAECKLLFIHRQTCSILSPA